MNLFKKTHHRNTKRKPFGVFVGNKFPHLVQVLFRQVRRHARQTLGKPCNGD
ncbi:MAG: hypothetical protein GY789_03775 [Hyphomicrobiales bacterium]|nr:hypothetical protein [Hyphomicrobiales bacterium]